jgi:predicted NBD/HSP70 family sugar kinase
MDPTSRTGDEVALNGQDPALLRRLNTAAVLRLLHSAGELTLTQIVQATEISRATVEDVVAGLQADGLAEDVLPKPDDRRQVGRPARRIRFRAEAGHVAGLDIGPHKLLVVVADLQGRVIETRMSSVSPTASPEERLSAARRLVRRGLRAAGVDPTDLRALGVATTGVVDPAGRKVVVSSRLPDWAGLDLADALSGLGTTVIVGNDTKLALLAEHWCGVAKGVDDVVYIHAGRSVSAGVLIGGRLHLGRHGGAGEIGVLDYMRWAQAFKHFGPDGAAPETVFAAAREGSAEAARSVRAFAAELARGIAAVVLTVDPELVVIGGGLSGAGSLLTEPLAAELSRLCLFPLRLESSTLGAPAVAYGALRLALNHVESSLFGV